jgi:CheY-like chemotaxis protein
MSPSETPLAGQRILWVEDDYYHLKGLVRSLVRKGCEIVNAGSYVEAIGLLSNWRDFSLILLDLIIPYSDTGLTPPGQVLAEEADTILAENGISLFNYIQNELKADIPVVLLTVVQTSKVIDDLMMKGARKRIYKSGLLPIDIEQAVSEALLPDDAAVDMDDPSDG